jgi:hypothetical protein
MCVSLKHGLVVESAFLGLCGSQLHLHSLFDGSFIGSFGSDGRGQGQFGFHYGGLCVSPDGDSVLVAEFFNRRVQQVTLCDGSWVRFIGVGVLDDPNYVDCDESTIAVSETWSHRISVLSWRDGTLLARCGCFGGEPGQLNGPCGLRLLADGSGLVVADAFNNRLCVFSLSGDFVMAVGSKG